jgi:hypothetical protein
MAGTKMRWRTTWIIDKMNKKEGTVLLLFDPVLLYYNEVTPFLEG